MPKASDWTKTKTQFVYRHKQSGRYYVRAYRQGREVWRALETDVYEVAKAKAKETLAEIHRPRILSAEISDKRTFGAVSDLHLDRVKNATNTKASTKRYWSQCVGALLRSWPGLSELRVTSITKDDCRRWAAEYLQAKRPPGHGWKSEPGTISASRFNNTLSALRSVFDLAIERGLILSNPAKGIDRVTPKRKRVTLPNRQDFQRVVTSIRTAGGAVANAARIWSSSSPTPGAASTNRVG